ncbi:50S ribosomal protein L10 [Silvanigrella paludirubra]|uniref:Large ribosomal subunit protein uL10 n=1 Tax=Silvanigrella paludirubra TaxID=2499159 RepID=A0A6N6VRC9_9BACT|nr:50S ribosomal protein L10 [Silvanigrella paludirubra]KAB8037613.1 50S ribosomal protein L10 [Silvanigrella paludirubra]
MDRNAKLQWRESVVQALDKSGAVFLANYSGMTVEELTAMRRELKAVQADFHVVKNTIAQKAVEGRDENVISELFKGQTGVVFAYGDAAAAAKVFSESAKKFEKLKIVGGYMEKSLLTPASVEKLASLPSREVLLGQLIGTMVAPHRGLLNVLNGVPRNLVQVLNAIKEKKAG